MPASRRAGAGGAGSVAVLPYISLFAGAGGLDLALRLALPESRCVCYVEGEIPAVEILAARVAEASLDDAPIWSDVRTFDGEPWRGRVDGIIGGFPCQDLSVAGKRAGIDGERSGLWGEFRRIIAEVQPRWVFIENVPGLISSRTLLHRRDILEHYDRLRDTAQSPKDRWYVEAHIERLHRRLLKAHGISALLYVGCQLEELGYRVEVEEIAASDIGAPHRRDRVFVLAVADAECASVLKAATGGAGDTRGTPVAGASGELADAGDGLIPQQGRGPEGRAGPRPAGAAVAQPESAGSSRTRPPTGCGPATDNACRSGGELFPPGPGDTEAWRELLVRQPWMRPAISQAEAQSALRGDPDGLANILVRNRTDALRACGNGVVPLQGALALAFLLDRTSQLPR